MTPLEIAGLTIFILLLFIGIFSILFGIPGTVIVLIDVILYALFTGFDKIGIKILIILLVISLLAETIDFALEMAGIARFGISKKMIWASAIGGFIGATIMTPLLYGLGTIAGTFLGGFTGVMMIDIIHQSRLKPALKMGYGLFFGRCAGMLVKGFLTLIMIIITLTNIYS